jgi:hypothetical protein
MTFLLSKRSDASGLKTIGFSKLNNFLSFFDCRFARSFVQLTIREANC